MISNKRKGVGLMAKNCDVNPINKDLEEETIDLEHLDKSEDVERKDTNSENEKMDANALEELLEKKEEEAQEQTDRIQRLAAEFDNYRKRTQKEKERIYIDALSDVASKFLPVVDNLQRALDVAEENESQGLKEGVNLVFKQMMEVLDKLCIKPIEAVGAAFDPEIHNAVMHVEDDSIDSNMVVEEFQKGYIYKDETVIRHSVVKVAN